MHVLETASPQGLEMEHYQQNQEANNSEPVQHRVKLPEEENPPLSTPEHLHEEEVRAERERKEEEEEAKEEQEGKFTRFRKHAILTLKELMFYIASFLLTYLNLICIALLLIGTVSIISSSVMYFLLAYDQYDKSMIYLHGLSCMFGSIILIDMSCQYISVFIHFLMFSWTTPNENILEITQEKIINQRRQSFIRQSSLQKQPVIRHSVLLADENHPPAPPPPPTPEINWGWQKWRAFLTDVKNSHPAKVALDQFKKNCQNDQTQVYLAILFLTICLACAMMGFFWGFQQTLWTLVIFMFVLATVYQLFNCSLVIYLIYNSIQNDSPNSVRRLLVKHEFTFATFLQLIYVIAIILINCFVLTTSKFIFPAIVVFFFVWYVTQAICYSYAIFRPLFFLSLVKSSHIMMIIWSYAACRILIMVIFLGVMFAFNPWLGTIACIYIILTLFGFGNKPGKAKWILPLVIFIIAILILFSLNLFIAPGTVNGIPTVSSTIRPLPLRYDVCSNRWGSLDVIDFGLISKMSYFDDSLINSSISTWFGNKLSYIPNTIAFCGQSNQENPGPKFHVYLSNEDNTSIISVKGGDSYYEMMMGMMLWQEITIFQVVMPSFTLLLEEFPVEYIGFLAKISDLFNPDDLYYYSSVVNCGKQILKSNRSVIFTGHGFGGGVAKIAADLTHQRSITFSSPGLTFSKKKYGTEGEDLNFGSITIMPTGDVITAIDKQTANVQWINCSGNLISCHKIDTTICEVRKSCGDSRGRNFIYSDNQNRTMCTS
eukprot:TRINITY_DN4959_c0_g1_i1.p1 TRINITY_DN4959_c0_g1~~TRINITY_DN4959_c0_g1_i1.p1  ORF type:complete len:771 (-),score=183.54 TRINITY_DN4959_c0_g1_i1:191-2503(-)